MTTTPAPPPPHIAKPAPANPEQLHARGGLVEVGDGHIVLALPGTDYRLWLVAERRPGTPGQGVTGTIRARARRIDVVAAGGRFIDPVLGRPRRLQGRIVAVDPAANTLTVLAACPFTCELTMNQQASQFQPGQLVSFDIERGARFDVGQVTKD